MGRVCWCVHKLHLFDDDDSFLRLLVGDDVEYVVPPHDAVFHLSVASHVGVVGLDSPDGPAHLGGLGRGYAKGIWKKPEMTFSQRERDGF